MIARGNPRPSRLNFEATSTQYRNKVLFFRSAKESTAMGPDLTFLSFPIVFDRVIKEDRASWVLIPQ